jgi:hypothetical protein
MKAVLRKSMGIYFKRIKDPLPVEERVKKERIHFSSLKMESPDFVNYLLSYIPPFVNPRYGPRYGLAPGWIMPEIQFISRLLGENKGQQAQGAYEEILIDSTFDPMLRKFILLYERHGARAPGRPRRRAFYRVPPLYGKGGKIGPFLPGS